MTLILCWIDFSSGNPTLGQTGQSYSLDQSSMSRRPDTLKTVNLQPSIEEDGESAGEKIFCCFQMQGKRQSFVISLSLFTSYFKKNFIKE